MGYLGGYLPEKDDFYLPKLPTYLCLTMGGIQEEIFRGIEYLDGRVVSSTKPTVKATGVVANAVNLDDFGKWFQNKVNTGRFWFHAELLFFGVRDVYRVRFINDLKVIREDMLNIVHLELEIDMFYNHFIDPTETYILFCDNLIECNEVLNCS